MGVPWREELRPTIKIEEYVEIRNWKNILLHKYPRYGKCIMQLTYTPVGEKGNEINSLFIVNDDGSVGKTLTQSQIITEETFIYNPDDNEIEVHGMWANSNFVAVYYAGRFVGVVECKAEDYVDYSSLKDCYDMPSVDDINMPKMPKINDW